MRHRCCAGTSFGVLSVSCRGVELGDEFAVRSACGGEILVAFFELQAQVDDLLYCCGRCFCRVTALVRGPRQLGVRQDTCPVAGMLVYHISVIGSYQR